MAQFPTIVNPVRVIGGPMGPAEGPTGPTGVVEDVTFIGATGLLGPTGMRGRTGPAGIAGLASALTGMTGKGGPTGADGYPGPAGPTGPFEFIPEGRFQYYENIVGFTLTTSGASVGCRFYYQPKRPACILFVMFTGLAEPTGTSVFKIGISSNTGPAPGGGEFSGYGDAIEIGDDGSGFSIPFTTTYVLNYRDSGDSVNIPPMRWFDLATYNGGANVRNINCIVLEF